LYVLKVLLLQLQRRRKKKKYFSQIIDPVKSNQMQTKPALNQGGAMYKVKYISEPGHRLSV
jgi:hypothetical protein